MQPNLLTNFHHIKALVLVLNYILVIWGDIKANGCISTRHLRGHWHGSIDVFFLLLTGEKCMLFEKHCPTMNFLQGSGRQSCTKDWHLLLLSGIEVMISKRPPGWGTKEEVMMVLIQLELCVWVIVTIKAVWKRILSVPFQFSLPNPGSFPHVWYSFLWFLFIFYPCQTVKRGISCQPLKFFWLLNEFWYWTALTLYYTILAT